MLYKIPLVLGVTSHPLLCRSELAREQHQLAGARFFREQARSYRRLEVAGAQAIDDPYKAPYWLRPQESNEA